MTLYPDMMDAEYCANALSTGNASGTVQKAAARHLSQLIEARDGYKQDAERYRWLRHGDNDEAVIAQLSTGGAYLPRNEVLDKMIDLGMESDLVEALSAFPKETE